MIKKCSVKCLLVDFRNDCILLKRTQRKINIHFLNETVAMQFLIIFLSSVCYVSLVVVQS